MMKMSRMQVEECNIGLALGIGSQYHEEEEEDDYYCNTSKKSSTTLQFNILFPPKSKAEAAAVTKRADNMKKKKKEKKLLKEIKGGSTRKKLKLTKEQSALLEDSFREQQTIHLTQKQELADRLNMRPRQVEVWFQNRRARNKLKQTEVDCERMLKWCETLSNENRRLKRELQELRMSVGKSTTHVQPAETMLTICPPCVRPEFCY